jgi:hypothetical protein
MSSSGTDLDSQKSKLVGKWEKITFTKCSEIYPDKLEFMTNGIYAGSSSDVALVSPYWDAGSYQLLSEDQVRISTFNDEEVKYYFTTSADTLIFTDGNECEFKYRRL